MRLAIFLLVVVVVAHATSNDSPIGFSWDDSHEQVIISLTNGRISFKTDPGKKESREMSSLDFGTSSVASNRIGPQAKPEHQCHAQAFHKSVNGDLLWRIEFFADQFFLIGYSHEQLLEGQLFRAILHGPTLLPEGRYTDVAVSASGVVSVVDSRGGILQGSPANEDIRNAQKQAFKLARKKGSDEAEGTRSIVSHDRAGGLIVATRESGSILWLDSTMNLRKSISLPQARLRTGPPNAMTLLFLRDGRLGVLFAGSLYLLQENVALREFTVIDVLEVGSEAMLLSHASTNRSIFILSGHATDSDSELPYSIRELKLPAYNACLSSSPVPRLCNTVPIQDGPRDSQHSFGVSSGRSSNIDMNSFTDDLTVFRTTDPVAYVPYPTRPLDLRRPSDISPIEDGPRDSQHSFGVSSGSNTHHISSDIDDLFVLRSAEPVAEVPYSIQESNSTVLRLSDITSIQDGHRYSQSIIGVSSVRSNGYLISSDTDGSIVVHDAETFSELNVFVLKGSAGNGINVTAQAVDESSNTLWRIEHWMDHYSYGVPRKVTFLVAYDLNQLLFPSTWSHFFSSVSASLGFGSSQPHRRIHRIKPSRVYQIDTTYMFVDLSCLVVIPDGSIFSVPKWSKIVQIQPLDKNLDAFRFKQGTRITVKEATLSDLSPVDDVRRQLYALLWRVQVPESTYEYRYQSAMVYHDSGLFLVPTKDCQKLERFDVNTKRWHSISIIDSSSSSASPVRDPAFPSAVFLSDGRLMIGSSRGVVLLEEVPVPTNERWMSARTVATAEPFPATTSRLCGHSICLSARDEILAVSLEENSHNLVARQLFIE